MPTHGKPNFGFMQPTNGFAPQLRCNPMKGQKKTPKVPGFMRSILAVNVARLLERHYPAMENVTQRQKALAKEAGVSFSTIQRFMDGSTGATIDNIEVVAAAFGLSAYQLLIPNLHAENPQLVKGATKDEERIYSNWRKAKTLDRHTEKV